MERFRSSFPATTRSRGAISGPVPYPRRRRRTLSRSSPLRTVSGSKVDQNIQVYIVDAAGVPNSSTGQNTSTGRATNLLKVLEVINSGK